MHLKIAISVLSAGALAYEILLIRLLSIIQWHHFAAMIISLALLGYGMSGTVLSLLEARFSSHHPQRWQWTFLVSALLFGTLSATFTVLVQRLPFNPLALVWDPRQILNLMAVYLLLAVPFFFAATAIGVALMSRPDRIGGLYGADLAGAAVGAVMLLVALFLLPVATCLKLVGALGCLAAGIFAAGYRRNLPIRRSALPVAAALGWVFLWPQGWLDLRLSEYKALRKTMLVPGSEILAERSSPLGLLTLVGNPNIPFRHAPGLSLNFPGDLPEQRGLFTDGDSMTVLNVARMGDNAVEHLDYLPAAVGYWVVDQPSVLILGAGGGGEIQMALQHQAKSVDVVEPNAQVIELLAHPQWGLVGGILRRADVRVHTVEARSFLRRTDSRFDLIQVPLSESLASASSGSRALGANHLLTVESFVDQLGILGSGGVMVFSHWLKVPPRENLKLVASLAAALESMGKEEPARHLAQIRGWGTVTTLVKKTPLQPREISAVLRFCEERSFDPTLLPGLTENSANKNNRLQQAYLYLGNKEILRNPQDFYRNYKFDVRPATDDRPFFSHTFKWGTLPELSRLGSRAGLPLVDWGYLTLIATVIQALVAAVVLILIPLRLVRRESTPRARMTVLVFFASLGVGFMLLELAYFQQFTLYLGHPTYSVAVVLAAFLVSAGLGSAFSRRLLDWHGKKRVNLGLVSMSIVFVGSIYWVGLPGLMGATIALPILLKLGMTFGMLAPLGFLLGVPFPLGLARAAARRSIWLPWAWGINGSASVVGAVLAPLIAVHLGFSTVLMTGMFFYALAGLCTGWSSVDPGVMSDEEE